MTHNPNLRFGRTIHLVPICIRGPHGYYGGPAGYQQMPAMEAQKRKRIILDARNQGPRHAKPFSILPNA